MNVTKLKTGFFCLVILAFGINSGCNALPENAANNAPPINLSTTPSDGFVCSEGWRVTGYYTPVESDFTSTETQKITVVDFGELKFNKKFLTEINNEEECAQGRDCGEGWGKTKGGWYLGFYDDKWYKSADPLDAKDTPLNVNSMAIDPAHITLNSKVTVPDLPPPFNQRIFLANDVGRSVKGKHVDIYCGEGEKAHTLMSEITREGNNLVKVCVKKP